MKLNIETPLRQHWVVLCIYALLVWVFVFATHTLFSGFHLSDDQILISFNDHLHKQSFFSAAYWEIKDDLFIRFRPLAIFYYVTLAKWPYPNFTLIAFLVSLQAILTCYFFYRFARYLKCGIVLSFLFPLFVLCGNQGVIFWRNCINETFAMFLLSISFFYLGKILNCKNGQRKNLFLFCLFLLLSTLTKESFIILVPAVLFLKLWQESLHLKKEFFFSAKQNIKLIIFFTIVVITEIAIIFYYKNQSNRFIEYVGVDENTFKLSNLFISLVRLWITKGYLIIVLPAMAYILFVKNKYNHNKDIRSFFLPLALLFLFITIPQILLYSKSLIFERYLLPGTLAGALAVLFVQLYILRYLSVFKFLNKIFLPASSVLLFLQVILMTKGAISYAATGYEVKQMLTTIMQHTKPTDTILLVAKPLGQSDQAHSTKTYLNAEIGGAKTTVFIEPVIDTTLNLKSGERSVVENFIEDTKGIIYNDIIDPKNISCITFFENTKDRFVLNHPDFDTTPYLQINIGKFWIFLKK